MGIFQEVMNNVLFLKRKSIFKTEFTIDLGKGYIIY